MALLTKKEFAGRAGLTTRELAVYVKRKKVMMLESGLIDDSFQMNIDFINRHASKKKHSAEARKPQAERKAEPKTAEQQKKETNQTELLDLEKEQKQLSIEGKKKEVALLEQRIRKINGELIPTDLVKLTFGHVFRELAISAKQEIDKLITDISKKAKLNGNQTAELRGSMIRVINQSINNGTNNAAKNLQNIISEYSVNKTAG